ncbi:MAG TPA: STAS domain-containing protein [Ilumatobacteraceae bacterium]|nr:STAS domain-containing protein [Ilumatobacteraceae bacterium]
MPSSERSRLTIHDAGDGVVLLVGEIDVATAPKLRLCLEHEPLVRVLDMEQVTFMDSSGLKVLAIANRSRDASDRITLRAPSAAVRRVVDISGMAKLLGLAPE